MRLRVLSDLHTEFGPVDLPAVAADVVVLAGDIGVGVQGIELAARLFPEKPVVYVAGNHEFYRHALPGLIDELRLEAERREIHFLENDSAVVAGVRFLGCTLWSDFALTSETPGPWTPMEVAAARMNDYKLIRRSPRYRKLTPRDTRSMHTVSRSFLERELARPFTGKTIVVSHHAPSPRSLNPAHGDDPLNAAFASDLEPLVASLPIDLWIHGHTHHSVRYELKGPRGPVRVLSNQRGYPGEKTVFDPALVVEL